ncbi:MAG: methylmalonyl-CoA mutase [Thermoleophilia bacterium]|nr:methylmalonyl-CoA mutase [Thermoleophilia bacterium]
MRSSTPLPGTPGWSSIGRLAPGEGIPVGTTRTVTTISGVPLAPVYEERRDEAPPPGEYPYTRGLHPQMYRTRPWTMRMFAGFGSPEDTNARFRHLLEEGQTGLSTAFDMPTLMGYDPDHPSSLGEVGREGVSAASADEMQRLFAGIDLGAVSTSLTISGPAPVALALFVVAARRSGVEPARLRGTLQADILKEFIAQKEWVVPERPSMRLIGDLIAWCTEEMPLWHPVSVSGYHIREAGSTAAQELAFTLADGLAYVEELVARGVDPDSFLPRFSFFFNLHIELFEEIAKLRAARRLWASLMRERVGAVDPRSWQMRTHVQTSGVSLTAQQPLLNVARVAIEALGAVMAGTQSLHTNAYDETLSIPTPASATLALRTQQMIAEETGVAAVADPLGGSYYVEALTDELERQARDYIARIDAMGGMVAAVEEGFPQAEIADASYVYQREFEAGERRVVGVNAHVEQEGDEPPIHRADPAVEARQVERVRALRARRDAPAHAAALGRLREACAGGANVMPHLVDAAEADATVGEMCVVLREVFGAYRDPGRW